jgi:regulator of sirC expression with transglutaminase-like and TPR domain
MTARVDLALFAHIVSKPEEEIDLAQAALLIAEPEYPGLDIPRYVRRLDELGAQARRRAVAAGRRSAPSPPGMVEIQPVLELLYGEHGFHGNSEDYYDPRNSYLNEALDRRTGIPITLAVVLIEVASRAGVEAQGVSFPAHFLVRARGSEGPLYVDPFEGRVLTRSDLRDLFAQASGERRDPDPHLLEPVPSRHILMRMLNNLRAIHAHASDCERLRRVLERMAVIAPTDSIRRDLAALDAGRPPSSSRNPKLN